MADRHSYNDKEDNDNVFVNAIEKGAKKENIVSQTHQNNLKNNSCDEGVSNGAFVK